LVGVGFQTDDFVAALESGDHLPVQAM